MMLSLQDRQDIFDLISRYNHAIDHWQAELWAGCFTADGALVVDGEVRAQGRQALIEYVARRRAVGALRLRHWVNNLLVTGNADTAKLSAYVMTFKLEDGLGPPSVLGEYDDDLVKIGGAWKFAFRRLIVVATTS